MLEHPQLLLRPWQLRTAQPLSQEGTRSRNFVTAARTRAILDAATEQELGFACWRPPGTGWSRWLSWPLLEVFETEDVSLLLTVQRLWGLTPRWGVCDAERKRIGSFWHFAFEPAPGADS